MERGIDELEKLVAEQAKLIQKYEENGPGKLYYALKRKSWELGGLLNDMILTEDDLEDAKGKKFERLLKLCENATKISEAVRVLEGMAGITGDEEVDIKKRKPITPQMVARGEFD